MSLSGLYRGVVADNADPQGLGRARLSVPSVFGSSISNWAPSLVSAPTPAIGTQVWVQFVEGSPNAPVWAYATLDTSGLQPLDADLTAIGGLTPSNDDLIQRKAGAWTNRTPAQVKTDLALTKSDVGLGNVDNTSDANKPVSTATQAALGAKQPLDADLTALAAANNSGVLAATTSSYTTAKDTKLAGIEDNADVTDAVNVNAAGAVMESDYDANTLLVATTDNLPLPLTMGASTILARLASGDIVAATPAQLRTLLALVVGTNVQAWDSDLDAIAAIATTAFGRALLALADAAALRAAAALGTIATQNANNVSISGGSVTGITDLAVADGGTGASTAAGALTNLGIGGLSSAWTSFTPTIGVISNYGTGATRTGKYLQVGKTVIGSAFIALGTGPTFSAGSFVLTLPVAALNNYTPGSGWAYDSSANTYWPLSCQTAASSTNLTVLRFGNAASPGSGPAGGAADSNLPFVWAASDILSLQFSYETT